MIIFFTWRLVSSSDGESELVNWFYYCLRSTPQSIAPWHRDWQPSGKSKAPLLYGEDGQASYLATVSKAAANSASMNTSRSFTLMC